MHFGKKQQITDLEENPSQGSRRETNSESSLSDSDENSTEHMDTATSNSVSFWYQFLCGSSSSFVSALSSFVCDVSFRKFLMFKQHAS
jgi:hypothetical protein